MTAGSKMLRWIEHAAAATRKTPSTPHKPMTVDINYDFVCPGKIVFGWGRRREAGVLGRTLGRRAFLVCGLPPEIEEGVISEIVAALTAEGVEPIRLATLLHEPEVEDVDSVATRIRTHNTADGDFLLAVGGGSRLKIIEAVGRQE